MLAFQREAVLTRHRLWIGCGPLWPLYSANLWEGVGHMEVAGGREHAAKGSSLSLPSALTPFWDTAPPRHLRYYCPSPGSDSRLLQNSLEPHLPRGSFCGTCAAGGREPDS